LKEIGLPSFFAYRGFRKESRDMEKQIYGDGMLRFYEGCIACAHCEEGCCKRCFECAQPDVEIEGWIHSLGFYFPRYREEHWVSKWSQAILRVKKKSEPVILGFGRIVAHYMDRWLTDMKPYVITGVPGFQAESEYLFSDFETSAMQVLACSVFGSLEDTKWVSVEQLLVQTQRKAVKQHRCTTDRQRGKNIRGIYAVQKPDRVEGRNIILLDDVITSGATMRECSETLLESGAKTVIGVALARTFRATVY
jgi:hypothetical protein